MNKAILSDRLRNAAYDYKYLLTRGYPVKASLNLVATRYVLSKQERLLLYRCIHSTQYVEKINKKLACSKINDFVLLIDFYNIVISTINMLRGGEVYLCDDCIPRDLRGSKLHHDDYPYLQKTLKVIAQAIEILKPRYVIAIVDKNISFSLEHSTMLGQELKNLGIEYSFELTSTPDSKIIDYSKKHYELIIATSDSLIMDRSSKITPLTVYIMFLLNIRPVYDFTQVFNSHCTNCFNELVQAIGKSYKCNS